MNEVISLKQPVHIECRRSQRIPLSVPLFVTSLDPSVQFCKHVNTVEVSRHGCLLRTLLPIHYGVRLRLHALYTDCTTTARVVHSEPVRVGTDMTLWHIALELDDKQGNFWKVVAPSKEWDLSA